MSSTLQFLSQMMQDCIRQNAAVSPDHIEYPNPNALTQRSETAESRHKDMPWQISDKQARKFKTENNLKHLKKQGGEINEFLKWLRSGLPVYSGIYVDDHMRFTFKAGVSIGC